MKQNMLGFINTYYSNKDLGIDVLLVELCLYLVYWIKYYRLSVNDSNAVKIIRCVEKSQSGIKYNESSDNLILRYLNLKNVRM